MSKKRTPPAAHRASETPQQKAAFTRRTRRAAREVARAMAAPPAPPPPTPAAAPLPPPNLPVEQADPPLVDAHGFDPADYKWLPVKRKPRKDGWSPQRQRDFIRHLAASGSVEYACMRVQMSPSSAYRLRNSPEAEQFSAAWNVALEHAARVLLDTAFERAFNGSTEPVFDRDGARTGTRFRQNDRLLMFLLRAYMPERFRHAHRAERAPDEPLLPPPPPMARMLERMEPVRPPAPHTLLDPDELGTAVACADILAGTLPGWTQGEPDAAPNPPVNVEWEERVQRLKDGVRPPYG